MCESAIFLQDYELYILDQGSKVMLPNPFCEDFGGVILHPNGRTSEALSAALSILDFGTSDE